MIDFLETVEPSPEQIKIVIEGMRNPMNSWNRMDSELVYGDPYDYIKIGPNDLGLMKKLNNAGPVHSKYRRMLPVWVTIYAPLYWWKEFDTYKVGSVCNSCSTMHKIVDREFTLSDFSHEHLFNRADYHSCDDPDSLFPKIEEKDGEDVYWTPTDVLALTIKVLNFYRERYFLETDPKLKKRIWLQIIQLLPTTYHQTRTVMLNYEILANMYRDRKNHKLDEWHRFCKWIERLEHSELITGEGA